MHSRLATVVLVALSVTACTHNAVSPDDLPTAPTTLQPTALTIIPLGGGTLAVGGTAPIVTSGALNGPAIGAFAQFGNGLGRYVEATWTSSDESIIGVEGDAMVARNPGTATLTATFEGLTDTEQFVVDSAFLGRWTGSLVIEQCGGSSGSMQDVLCRPADASGRAGIAPVGTAMPVSMEIVRESGADISGRVSFGPLSGPLAGRNRGGGYFYLAGEIPGPGGMLNIAQWEVRALGGEMAGIIAYQLKLDGLPGIGTVGGRLSNMTRQ